MKPTTPDPKPTLQAPAFDAETRENFFTLAVVAYILALIIGIIWMFGVLDRAIIIASACLAAGVVFTYASTLK